MSFGRRCPSDLQATTRGRHKAPQSMHTRRHRWSERHRFGGDPQKRVGYAGSTKAARLAPRRPASEAIPRFRKIPLRLVYLDVVPECASGLRSIDIALQEMFGRHVAIIDGPQFMVWHRRRDLGGKSSPEHTASRRAANSGWSRSKASSLMTMISMPNWR
jgi:hypothetical protein